MFEEKDSRAIAQMMRNGEDIVELLSFLHPAPRYDRMWDGRESGGFNLLAFRAESFGETAGVATDPGHADHRHGVDPNGVRLEFILSGPGA
jgi:hypothetical protein